MRDESPVVELEFVLDGDRFPLGRASAIAEGQLTVKLAVPRSDGGVLAFVEVSGTSTAAVIDCLRADGDVREVRLLDRGGEGELLEVVMDSRLVTVPADAGAVVTRLSATDGRGRLVADVPPHVDAHAVIEAVVDVFPSARIVARRRTDRRTPQLGQSQFVTQALTRFTERQLHVLMVAYDRGYFEWPRDNKAEEVAEALGIATPTFSQHIRAAERKLTELLFEG